MFVTVTVKTAPCCPCVNEPACVITIARSGGGTIAVSSIAESLSVAVSPPPLTTTVFCTSGCASSATATVTTTAGYTLPAASPSERVQLAVSAVQVQPAPAIPQRNSPARRSFGTGTSPPASAGPPVPTGEPHQA